MQSLYCRKKCRIIKKMLDVLLISTFLIFSYEANVSVINIVIRHFYSFAYDFNSSIDKYNFESSLICS